MIDDTLGLEEFEPDEKDIFVPWYLDGTAAGEDAKAIAEANGGQPRHVTVHELMSFFDISPKDIEAWETEWQIYCRGVNNAADTLMERNWSSAELDRANQDYLEEFGHYPF